MSQKNIEAEHSSFGINKFRSDCRIISFFSFLSRISFAHPRCARRTSATIQIPVNHDSTRSSSPSTDQFKIPLNFFLKNVDTWNQYVIWMSIIIIALIVPENMITPSTPNFLHGCRDSSIAISGVSERSLKGYFSEYLRKSAMYRPA